MWPPVCLAMNEYGDDHTRYVMGVVIPVFVHGVVGWRLAFAAAVFAAVDLEEVAGSDASPGAAAAMDLDGEFVLVDALNLFPDRAADRVPVLAAQLVLALGQRLPCSDGGLVGRRGAVGPLMRHGDHSCAWLVAGGHVVLAASYRPEYTANIVPFLCIIRRRPSASGH